MISSPKHSGSNSSLRTGALAQVVALAWKTSPNRQRTCSQSDRLQALLRTSERINAKVAEIAATDDMKARMLAANVIVPVQKPEEVRQYHMTQSLIVACLSHTANVWARRSFAGGRIPRRRQTQSIQMTPNSVWSRLLQGYWASTGAVIGL